MSTSRGPSSEHDGSDVVPTKLDPVLARLPGKVVTELKLSLGGHLRNIDVGTSLNRREFKKRLVGNTKNCKLGGFFFFDSNGYHIFFVDDPLTIKNNTTKYPQGFATPGAVQEIDFSTGAGDTAQPTGHQLAFYFQDDYKVTPKLTLNLGLRWDANINILPAQTNNRTMLILQKVNDPRAKALTSDLNHRTPSFREFQPRVGFAYDPKGDGRTVIRGGYGIFYDQVFQNLTLFSQQQSNPTIYQTVLADAPPPTFRFGIDPLPAPPPGSTTADLLPGAVGRIIPPDMKDPYVQKFSIGFEQQLGRTWAVSSDYVHTLGIHEPRVLNINPRMRRICDPAYGGNTGAPQCLGGSAGATFRALSLGILV